MPSSEEEAKRMSRKRNHSSSFSDTDRNGSLYSYSKDEQTVIATQYTHLDSFLAEFSNGLKEEYELTNNKRFETNEYSQGRNIIKLMSSGGREYFHFSLFIKEDEKTGIRRYGGLHITCPSTTKRLYLEHDNILEKSSEGAKFCNELLKQLFKTLKTYFETEKHSNGDDLEKGIKHVIYCILDQFPNRDVAKRQICESLDILIRKSDFKPLYDSFPILKHSKYGGSTKSVMYLVKIDKLKQKNKLLKKDKIKNKNKIEKNNKLIQELKAKAKKEKAKAKAKAKAKKEKAKAKKEKAKVKVKAKAKAKKVTCKKSTCSKKNKK
tara:strand:+ start:881 stop:1846 length:966 start_codon:yes stop_codon:yes gene_type:complete